MGETSWGSWTLRRADADLDTVVAEATRVLPQQVRGPVAEMAGDYYQSLDAALAYDAPALLAEHLWRYRSRLAELSPGLDRAALLRSLCDVLGRHVDPETRVLVNTLVSQTVLIAGQRPPQPSEQLPETWSRGLVGRLLDAVDEGRHDQTRSEVVRALEDGCAPHLLLEEVLVPFHDALLARHTADPLPRPEAERQQEMVRTLLFSVVQPDLTFPVVSRRVLVTEPYLPVGWRAGLARTVFEVAGWQVDTVLDDSGPEAFGLAARAHGSQVVVVPADRAGDLGLALERIAAVRAATPGAMVLAQGRPFRAAPDLAARLGADEGCGGLGLAVRAASRLHGPVAADRPA